MKVLKILSQIALFSSFCAIPIAGIVAIQITNLEPTHKIGLYGVLAALLLAITAALFRRLSDSKASVKESAQDTDENAVNVNNAISPVTPEGQVDGNKDPHKENRWRTIDRLDTSIKFEFELTAQRITYLAISESFLFSAYATSLASLKTGESPIHADKIEMIISAIPWVGVSLAGIVFFSILGAVSMIFKLKDVRSKIETTEESLHPDIGSNSLEHYFGLLPPLCIPIGFFVVWICVWPNK